MNESIILMEWNGVTLMMRIWLLIPSSIDVSSVDAKTSSSFSSYFFSLDFLYINIKERVLLITFNKTYSYSLFCHNYYFVCFCFIFCCMFCFFLLLWCCCFQFLCCVLYCLVFNVRCLPPSWEMWAALRACEVHFFLY